MIRKLTKEERIANWQRNAQHMLKTLDKIERFKTHRAETDPEIYQDAIYRNLHTFSESADYIPQNIKDEYPKIIWHEVKGFRNILVHNYLGDDIDTKIVEHVVYQDLPVLQDAVRDMLERYPVKDGDIACGIDDDDAGAALDEIERGAGNEPSSPDKPRDDKGDIE